MKNNINNKDIMSVKNLYFKYRRNDDYIIRDASFSIKEGMLYGMVGKNSVGKSTLLKLLCGREDKHTGEITINNHTDIVYLKNNIGIVSKEQKLFKELTVYENGIMFEKSYEGFRIEEFLEYINIYNINRNDRFELLSESEKIKVRISLVLARHVKVIVLDEPTGVLDVTAREDFMKLLRDITIEKNISVIMATHLTSDIDKAADYIIFVNEDGTVDVEDGESLHDKYMLLKGKKADIAELPKETVVAYEETETSIAAMCGCFSDIRDKVEKTDIITEIPDIGTIMYYKNKSKRQKQYTESADINTKKLKMTRTKSEKNTYKDVERIYHGLFSMYGIKWGMAVFSVIWIIVTLMGEENAYEIYKIILLVIPFSMFSDSMVEPKKIDRQELYSEVRYLPVRIKDVLKYILSKRITGVALCMITAGLILIYMGRYETLEELVFVSIGTIIFDTGYLTYKLLVRT